MDSFCLIELAGDRFRCADLGSYEEMALVRRIAARRGRQLSLLPKSKLPLVVTPPVPRRMPADERRRIFVTRPR